MSLTIIARALLHIMPLNTGIVIAGEENIYLTYTEEDLLGNKNLRIVDNNQTQLDLNTYQTNTLLKFDFVPLMYPKESIQ